MNRWLWIVLGVLTTSMAALMVFFYPFNLPFYEQLGVARYIVEPILLSAPFCAIWMAYRAIRHEAKPLAYVLLACFVPFAFVWYYVERVRPGKSGSLGPDTQA